MRKSALIFFCITLALLFVTTAAQSQEKTEFGADDQCIVCHLEIDFLPADFSNADIHLQKGLSCAGCHGGDVMSDDVEIAKRAEAKFTGIPTKKDIAGMCGKCHSDISFMRKYQPRISVDQARQYKQSVHGQKLAQGDTKVADCSSCHTAHSILSATDARSTIYSLNVPKTCTKCHGDQAYMADYNIPTTQYDEYVESVHGKALLEKQDVGAPACNDCHGNHGAMPPGIVSISHVCGACHVNNQDFFSKSKMANEFADADLHACEECHGVHDIKNTFDDMVGTGETSTCTECHGEGETGYQVAQQIRSHLGDLVAVYDSASILLKNVEHVGMDVLDMSYAVKDAKQSLTQARTLVHTFDSELVQTKTEEGKTSARHALHLGNAEMEELRFRRFGFGVATFFMTIVLAALYFKIKDIEKE